MQLKMMMMYLNGWYSALPSSPLLAINWLFSLMSMVHFLIKQWAMASSHHPWAMAKHSELVFQHPHPHPPSTFFFFLLFSFFIIIHCPPHLSSFTVHFFIPRDTHIFQSTHLSITHQYPLVDPLTSIPFIRLLIFLCSHPPELLQSAGGIIHTTPSSRLSVFPFLTPIASLYFSFFIPSLLYPTTCAYFFYLPLPLLLLLLLLCQHTCNGIRNKKRKQHQQKKRESLPARLLSVSVHYSNPQPLALFVTCSPGFLFPFPSFSFLFMLDPRPFFLFVFFGHDR